MRFSVGGHDDSDFATPIPPSAQLEARKQQYRVAADVDLVIRPNDKTQLSIEGSQSIAQQNEMLPNYQINDDYYNITSLKGHLAGESRFGLLQATAYTNWLRMDSNPGLLDQPLHPRNRVTAVQLNDVFGAGRNHILRAAVEYRHNTENTTPTSGGTIFYNLFAVSGMWDWKITTALSLTNAVRIDHLALGREGPVDVGYPFINSDWDRSITQPSVNTGLVWKPSDSDSLRFMISRGAQLPSLILSGAYLQQAGVIKVSGTPFLNPSPVTNYEVGWDHLIPRLHIVFRSNAFYQTSASLLTVAGKVIVTATGPYVVPANIGSSDAGGVELGAKGVLLKNYRWSVDYRPEWISDHLIPSAQNGAAVIDYQHTTPVHLVKANLGWANKRWEIDGYLHYQSHTHGLQATSTATVLIPIGGFLSFDGRIAYNLANRVTWSVSGQNLTHASQIQTSGPAVERRVLGTVTFHF
jgi:outer membrane receptor for ferrienterochelin and colicins